MSFNAADPARFSTTAVSSMSGGEGEQEPFDVQLWWRIAPFLQRTAARSHCNCGGLRSQGADELALGMCLPLCIRLCSVQQGPFGGGTRRCCFAFLRPSGGLGSSQNKFEDTAKNASQTSFRAPPRKQTFGTWEPGPLNNTWCDPSNNERTTPTETLSCTRTK